MQELRNQQFEVNILGGVEINDGGEDEEDGDAGAGAAGR